MATGKYDVIGTRPIRHDGADKVTGRAKYGADVQLNGLLHGKILRSPHAHARIKSIDTSKAEKLPGVMAVVTAKDMPKAKPGDMADFGLGPQPMKYLRDNAIASDKALYEGHAIAAVAAVNSHIAEEALALIKVEYEVLPPVMTAPDGMKKDAAILLDDLRTMEGGAPKSGKTNVASRFQHKMGDIDKGFKDADIVIEREFNTATVHQGYIEPQNVTALWNSDGRLSIWISTQGPFEYRKAMALAFDLPVSSVKVTPMEIGGGFGGKFPLYHEAAAAALSRKSGRPVKIVMSRREVFEGTGPTPGSYIKVKIGAKKNGKLVAAQGYLAYEAGAYPGSPVDAAGMCIFTAYDIPNVVIDGADVVVNKPKTAAYRAPGATNAAFATETVLDEIADKLKIDPLDFRMMNAAREGTRRADGPVFPKVGLMEVLEAMKNHPHYKAPLKGKNVGRGVAVGFWFNAGLHSSATVSVNSDGTVNLVEGSPDIGGSRASLSMQVAEVLSIKAEDVHPTVVDTDNIGFTFGTGGSRVTFATGWAAYEAANDVKRQLIDRAAKIWGVKSKDIELSKGTFRSKADSELKMSFADLAERLNETGGPVIGRGTVNPAGVGAAFAGNIVDVEVDPETGKTQVKRFTIVQDAGKAIHPSYVEGQMQGGSVQGIGWGLTEEYFYNQNGQMANWSLLDYRLMTSYDLPMIDTVIVEVPNPGHPYGVRGVGEVNIVPPPAALANAIYDAVGVRMERLPMNPTAIMETLWSRKKGNGAGAKSKK
ncbi:MAG: xanthine dehydrogenase family protein molybdopterin-binding subunit [SAR202 cluster bacterium]|nr:xanthine dehydrogenase family protein molybdopterin-binding subunit [SAR202 cluster bacterium]